LILLICLTAGLARCTLIFLTSFVPNILEPKTATSYAFGADVEASSGIGWQNSRKKYPPRNLTLNLFFLSKLFAVIVVMSPVTPEL